MRRRVRIYLSVAAILIGLPIVAILLALLFANTGAGRHMAERLIADASDGTVRIEGLAGRFPDDLRATQVEVRDAGGAWVTVDDLEIAWSPLRLLDGEADITRLVARHVALARRPEDQPPSKPQTPSSDGFTLPVPVVIQSIEIGQLDIAAPIAGMPASLAVHGKGRVVSERNAGVDLTINRLDGKGAYLVNGTASSDGFDAKVKADEPAEGLLANLAGLPDLGPLAITATLAGPRTAERTDVTIAAGPLRAAGKGAINLDAQTLDLTVSANAPAMKPAVDVSWNSIALDAHVRGSFTRPDATGHLDIEDIEAGGAKVAAIKAELEGSTGRVGVDASIAGLAVPDMPPDLFAAAPIILKAEARLDQASRPVTFTLQHPLIHATGSVDTGTTLDGSADVTLTNLAPIAAAFGQSLQGSTTTKVHFTQNGDRLAIVAGGSLGLTGGLQPTASLIGSGGKFDIAVALDDDTITIDHATIDGAAIQASTEGSVKGDEIDLHWKVALADLSRLAATVHGTVAAEGTARGPEDDLAVTASGHAQVATPGVPTGPIDFSLTAAGLPERPNGQIEAHGSLAGAPLQLAAKASRDPDGVMHVAIDRTVWKSVQASGSLVLPSGTNKPAGQIKVQVAKLDDLTPFIGAAVSGKAEASLDMAQIGGKPRAKLQLDATGLGFAGNTVGHLTLAGWVDDPMASPSANLQLHLDGIAAEGISGSAGLDIKGPPDKLALHLDSRIHEASGDATLSADATVAVPQKTVRVTALQANYAGKTARLLAPVRVSLADGVAVDRLRLGVDDAELSLAGRILPTLDVTAAVKNVSPAMAQPFLPISKAEGRIAMDAKLTGPVASPTGSIHLQAQQLRWRSLSAQSLPAGELDATADIKGGAVQLKIKLAAGDLAQLTLTGTAPLGTSGALDLKTAGNLDLKSLDPILTAAGRSLHGRLNLDVAVAGTVEAPRVSGTMRLADGVFQDFTQGVHLTALAGTIAADGTMLHLNQMTGRAGNGNFTVTGTIQPLAPGMPVDLAVTGHAIQPIATDMLTATMDTNLTIKGKTDEAITVAGHVGVKRAEINIPDSLPPNVVALKIGKPGAPPPAPSSLLKLSLDVTVNAPEQIFVRGHGLDAEMGGTVHVTGDTSAPQIGGGFDLRHGTLSLAGQTIDITSGRVSFGGTGPSGKLDPSMDFIAQNVSGGITAVLEVTGYADAPVIKLSSTPPLPSDEVLAHLLYNESSAQLSPFQIAAIAQAVASLSGVGGGFDPLADVRKTLGIDRLTVGSGSGTNSGTTVEAGKYVANGIYVGTKQGTSGGTQAQVQVDLTKRLKLESTVGSGGGTPATGATIDDDPGSNVGLTYQFEY